MPTIEHSVLANSELHEPKGVSAASSGQVYVANGTGGGSWRYIPHSSCYYTNIGTGTTYTTPTSFTLVNPTSTGDSSPKDMTHNSASRLTYTGSTTLDFNASASITLKHSSASLVDVHFQFYKNGSAITGAEHVTAALSGNYTHVSLNSHFSLAQNDYVEVYTKSASGNVVVHSITITLEGKL